MSTRFVGDPDAPRFGGAVWCEEHSRWECTRNSKRTKLKCHAVALRNSDRCKFHAGVKAEVARAQGEALSAWSALTVQQGVEAGETVDHATAVLGMLHMSWLRVHMYAELLRKQIDRDGSEHSATGLGGTGGTSGLVGHTFGAAKDVGVYVSGEAVRGLAQLEAQERDRCVKFAKTAHDMGIAEAQLEVANRHGEAIVAALRAIFADLNLTSEQEALLPTLVPMHLRRIHESTATGAA